jgi:hypothetical protein
MWTIIVISISHYKVRGELWIQLLVSQPFVTCAKLCMIVEKCNVPFGYFTERKPVIREKAGKHDL